MVLLNAPPGTSKAYLDESNVLPSLEIGLEEMLKSCVESGRDPINYLAEFLMRNNPNRNPKAAERIAALREAANREARKQQQEADRMAAAEAAKLFSLDLFLDNGDKVTLQMPCSS